MTIKEDETEETNRLKLILLDPRHAVSQRLWLPASDDDRVVNEPFELPEDKDGYPGGYDKFLRGEACFAVAGMNVVISCGLLPSWYNRDDVRQMAEDLIMERGWKPALEALRRDNRESLFGKESLGAFFNTFPRVEERDLIADYDPNTEVNEDNQYLKHRLRFRQVLEFILLTECVLRWRFDCGQTLSRFAGTLGEAVSIPAEKVAEAAIDNELVGWSEDHSLILDAYARRVWDLMGAEPLLYTVEDPPRRKDIPKGLRNAAILGRFRSGSLQGAHPDIEPEEQDDVSKGVLYWIWRGFAGRYKTVVAAASASTQLYPNMSPSGVITVDPRSKWLRDPVRRQKKKRGKVVGQAPSEHEEIFEDIRVLETLQTANTEKQADSGLAAAAD